MRTRKMIKKKKTVKGRETNAKRGWSGCSTGAAGVAQGLEVRLEIRMELEVRLDSRFWCVEEVRRSGEARSGAQVGEERR
ncbi:hypothetical protein ACOSP7_008107 [Xanthoceras sorbifolium]